MKYVRVFLVLLAVFCFSYESVASDKMIPEEMLSHMPIKEVTVFKDGHAFILHSGELEVNKEGHIVIDYLPRPVLGTFWPYSDDKLAKLKEVTASMEKIQKVRRAINIYELLKTNIGASIIVREIFEDKNPPYEAEIIDVPEESKEPLFNDEVSRSRKSHYLKDGVVLLKTKDGVKAVKINDIKDITFKGKFDRGLLETEFNKTLTLKLDWSKKKPAKKASIGMVYLERGIRWIPSYKVTIDGNGKAIIRLQASLINELADLDNVTAHLVIGVPTFAFKDEVDPISLEKTIAKLSQYFQPNAATGHAFSNAIMSQSINIREERRRGNQDDAMYLGPEVDGSGKNEDLFVFTVKNITLKKGQRTTFFIDEFTLDYKDVYTLDVPFSPPPEVWKNFNSSRQSKLEQLFRAPKVMHKIRMKNDSPYPLTTAPALILKNDRIIAQGMMKYTPISSVADLEITTAVDIKVEKKEKETNRVPNAVKWNGYNYGKVELTGNLKLTNYKKETIQIEVVRHVLGNIDSADNDGEIEAINMFEDAAIGNRPFWWSWVSWPYWWYQFNSVGKATWIVSIETGKGADLNYKWHYFWR